MHCVARQLKTSALNELFGINLKSTVLEKVSGGQTRLSQNSRHASGAQCRLDVAIETGCDPLASKGRMRIEHVKMTVKLVGGEASNYAVMLGDHGVKYCEPVSPQANIRVRGCPSGKLLCGVERGGECMDGRSVDSDDLV